MAKGQNAAQSYGSQGRQDVLQFDPEMVSIVYDSRHPLYEKGRFNDIDIDIAKIPGGEKHPCYDEEGAYLPLDAETMANIDEHGILEPGAVRKNGERSDGTPIIETIFGRQRVKMLRAINRVRAKAGQPLYRFPAIIKRGDDAKIMGMWVSENAHRRTTSPLATARNIQRYLDYGRTEAEAGIQFKCTVQTVKANLTLLDLGPAVQKAVETGQIKPTLAAQEFSKIPREEQKGVLDKLLESGALKGAKAKETVKQLRGAKATERARPAKVIKKAIKTLSKLEGTHADVAAATLKWALGKSNALVPFPKLEAALDPEPAAAE